jgi:hypothetical protein
MKRQGGGFGIIMLLVVMVIVLMLVARKWKSVAPNAIEVSTPAGQVQVPDHGDAEAGAAVRSGGLPNLGDMQRETGAHTQQVQETLQQID